MQDIAYPSQDEEESSNENETVERPTKRQKTSMIKTTARITLAQIELEKIYLDPSHNNHPLRLAKENEVAKDIRRQKKKNNVLIYYWGDPPTSDSNKFTWRVSTKEVTRASLDALQKLHDLSRTPKYLKEAYWEAIEFLKAPLYPVYQKTYTVERIVDKRRIKGKVQYKIKWEGYPLYYNTWESEERLQGEIPEIIEKFESDSRIQKIRDEIKEANLKTIKQEPNENEAVQTQEETPAVEVPSEVTSNNSANSTEARNNNSE